MNYIQQAYKGKNEWYHWLLTILLVFIGWQAIGVIPLSLVAWKKVGNLDDFMKAAEDSFMSIGLNSNLLLFLMILMFFLGFIFLLIGVKYIHKRSITSLVTSREKIDWKRFWFGFFIWGIIASITITAGIFLAPENYVWNFNAVPFFILLAISILFLPFQTSFEELLFRGYFMQGLGIATLNKRFPLYLIITFATILVYIFRGSFNIEGFEVFVLSAVVFLAQFFLIDDKFLNSKFNATLIIFFKTTLTPLIITSVTFGLLHGANPEVEKLGPIAMVFYIGTGFFYGITTLMDEGTELSLGLHAVNNMVAAFFVTTDWTVFQTDALYRDISEPSVGWEMFFPVLVLYPLILFVFSKKYGWQNWSEKLAGKIEKPAFFTKNYDALENIGQE
ncbi:MAG: CPBP family glutamic-type intramembrane protease [Polaribacter sp.]